MDSRNWSDEDLIEAYSKYSTVRDVFAHVGLKAVGGNLDVVKRHSARLGLDYDSLTRANPVYKHGKYTLEDILVKDSTYSSSNGLKKRLFQSGVLAAACAFCGIDSWRGNAITLELDHINGQRSDNRLENLRVLCPNCHSQTPTWRGRNNARKQTKSTTTRYDRCTVCGASKALTTSIKCVACSGTRTFKIVWPKPTELIDMVERFGYSKTGRVLGVTDNAVRKHLKNQGA